MSEPLWKPSAERIAAARITRYRERTQERLGRSLPDYESLWAWSVADPADFWGDLLGESGIRTGGAFDRVVDDPHRLPGARWFEGATLNFAENLLRRRDAAPAVVFRGEGLEGSRRLSFAELRSQVARLARGLRQAGIQPGDRVAGFLPNLPETLVAMLAATSVGAVWSSCSPDFGVSGVLDRFGQIQPRVLLCADGYVYGGKRFDSLPVASDLAQRMPSVEHLVVIPYLETEPDLSSAPQASAWAEWLGADDDPPLDFEELPFDHPVYVLYSSGTTGVPKCIVHGAGGILLQHWKEHALHTDLGPEDRLFYFTTCGWMMWNWLVGALGVGSTLVLYDGSPFAPDGGALFRLAREEEVTVFGTSARFLASAEKADVSPRQEGPLPRLRSILSTGSPLSPESFRYVYREIEKDVCLSSIAGGTDICSCFFPGHPALPVHAGELQCRGLGMAVQAFDAEGRSVVGRSAELVCTQAAPCMPVGFWNDSDGSRYRAAYFGRFPGVWHHGDWVEITERGSAHMAGRSDTTLNPGGVRIGTAEIYRPVESVAEVEDALVVGQTWDDDVRVVLFVKLREGTALDDELRSRIAATIRRRATPRHVPARILSVDEIPYTRSGKKVELAVRDVVHGRPVANREAIANPEALECFRDRAELRR